LGGEGGCSLWIPIFKITEKCIIIEMVVICRRSQNYTNITSRTHNNTSLLVQPCKYKYTTKIIISSELHNIASPGTWYIKLCKALCVVDFLYVVRCHLGSIMHFKNSFFAGIAMFFLASIQNLIIITMWYI
jgi:hypothetical protein